jgi:tRNA1(Val) A37 N6-methylase TrmN6
MNIAQGRDQPVAFPGETVDGVLGGTVSLVQPRKGYRFSIDSVLLARFAAEKPVARAIDLGTGCGVVALCLLALGGAREAVGIDLQEAMVDRARRAVAGSRWASVASFLAGDLRRAPDLLPSGSFGLAVCNPPYRAVAAGRVSPDSATALARHEVACTLDDVASAAAYLLPQGGAFCAVYPAGRLTALLETCRGHGLEPRALRLVYPHPGANANLALLRCSRGKGEGLEVRSPLVLHVRGAGYSLEAERLLGPPETAELARRDGGPRAPPGGFRGRG